MEAVDKLFLAASAAEKHASDSVGNPNRSSAPAPGPAAWTTSAPAAKPRSSPPKIDLYLDAIQQAGAPTAASEHGGIESMMSVSVTGNANNGTAPDAGAVFVANRTAAPGAAPVAAHAGAAEWQMPTAGCAAAGGGDVFLGSYGAAAYNRTGGTEPQQQMFYPTGEMMMAPQMVAQPLPPAGLGDGRYMATGAAAPAFRAAPGTVPSAASGYNFPSQRQTGQYLPSTTGPKYLPSSGPTIGPFVQDPSTMVVPQLLLPSGSGSSYLPSTAPTPFEGGMSYSYLDEVDVVMPSASGTGAPGLQQQPNRPHQGLRGPAGDHQIPADSRMRNECNSLAAFARTSTMHTTVSSSHHGAARGCSYPQIPRRVSTQTSTTTMSGNSGVTTTSGGSVLRPGGFGTNEAFYPVGYGGEGLGPIHPRTFGYEEDFMNAGASYQNTTSATTYTHSRPRPLAPPPPHATNASTYSHLSRNTGGHQPGLPQSPVGGAYAPPAKGAHYVGEEQYPGAVAAPRGGRGLYNYQQGPSLQRPGSIGVNRFGGGGVPVPPSCNRWSAVESNAQTASMPPPPPPASLKTPQQVSKTQTARDQGEGCICFCIARPPQHAGESGSVVTRQEDDRIPTPEDVAADEKAVMSRSDHLASSFAGVEPKLSVLTTTVGAAEQLQLQPPEIKILYREDLKLLSDALQSLYDDRIFPGEKILKARLQQMMTVKNSTTAGGARPGPQHENEETILEHFLTFYDTLPGYRVTFDDAADTSAEAVQRKQDRETKNYYNVDEVPNVQFERVSRGFKGWIDPNSPEDPYPESLWVNMSRYLERTLREANRENCCREQQMQLAGMKESLFHRGRYGMAQELHRRQTSGDERLEFLRGYTIGETCHIVERAIQRKILAYENSLLLPVSACHSFKNALLGAPNQGNREPPDMYVQSMSELRRYLAVLLQAWPAGFNLSVVKIKIRTIFQKILSETVFHETKLLELMRKAELHDVCKITKLNKGYWIESACGQRAGAEEGRSSYNNLQSCQEAALATAGGIPGNVVTTVSSYSNALQNDNDARNRDCGPEVLASPPPRPTTEAHDAPSSTAQQEDSELVANRRFLDIAHRHREDQHANLNNDDLQVRTSAEETTAIAVSVNPCSPLLKKLPRVVGLYKPTEAISKNVAITVGTTSVLSSADGTGSGTTTSTAAMALATPTCTRRTTPTTSSSDETEASECARTASTRSCSSCSSSSSSSAETIAASAAHSSFFDHEHTEAKLRASPMLPQTSPMSGKVGGSVVEARSDGEAGSLSLVPHEYEGHDVDMTEPMR